MLSWPPSGRGTRRPACPPFPSPPTRGSCSTCCFGPWGGPEPGRGGGARLQPPGGDGPAPGCRRRADPGRPRGGREGFRMSGQLPRLEGLATPDKYERLLERVPDLWWGSASPFAGLHQLNVARVAYFRSVFGGFQGKRVLDIGCGGGILAESLAAEGAHVTAIDLSEKSLAVAREHAAQSGLTIDYRLATAESLASGDFAAHFDLVFATGVLQQAADLDSAIAGIARVLP